MEDASSIQLPLHEDPSSAYFAVFDGHGTQRFATYCSEELHRQLLSESSYGELGLLYCLKQSHVPAKSC